MQIKDIEGIRPVAVTRYKKTAATAKVIVLPILVGSRSQNTKDRRNTLLASLLLASPLPGALQGGPAGGQRSLLLRRESNLVAKEDYGNAVMAVTFIKIPWL